MHWQGFIVCLKDCDFEWIYVSLGGILLESKPREFKELLKFQELGFSGCRRGLGE